jgi:soluble lytic murein transglycosylase
LKRRKRIGLITAVVLFCIAYFAVLQIPVLAKMVYPLYFKEEIVKYSEEYKLSAPLVAAVIKTESNFNVFAESGKDAKGLMQITPSTGVWIAEKLTVNNYNEDMLFDPEINIRFGCWYLRHLADYYDNNFALVFAAYNGGRGNVDKWLENNQISREGEDMTSIPFEETRNFVSRVNRNYKVYSKLYTWDETK